MYEHVYLCTNTLCICLLCSVLYTRILLSLFYHLHLLYNSHIPHNFDPFSGLIIKYDGATGKEVARKREHKNRINRITFNADKTLFITACKDCDAKLFDPYTLDVIKVFRTDRPVNGAVISPTHPHVRVTYCIYYTMLCYATYPKLLIHFLIYTLYIHLYIPIMLYILYIHLYTYTYIYLIHTPYICLYIPIYTPYTHT